MATEKQMEYYEALAELAVVQRKITTYSSRISTYEQNIVVAVREENMLRGKAEKLWKEVQAEVESWRGKVDTEEETELLMMCNND